MSMMRVALFGNRAQAEPVVQRLREQGFEASVNEGPTLTKLWFVSKQAAGARVEVPADQFEKAQQFLLDWDSAENALAEAIRCPECQSLRVDYPQYAKNSLLTNLALGLFAEIGLIEKNYYCEDCHFNWPKEGKRARRDRSHLAPFYFIEGVEQTTLAQRESRRKSPAEEQRKAA
jgi:hypothetical protein